MTLAVECDVKQKLDLKSLSDIFYKAFFKIGKNWDILEKIRAGTGAEKRHRVLPF